ncbi:Predicted alpha-1,6-mannanase, GH76 family [Mycobacterium numidiamassiliense]|uniref:Predicted alpha-1,6-mannanase, GH76 family n=1 Tax=Mycobacterium numidiamassiliense TaxID=1841861 RepID=A0A2U3P4D7_9MYCO|nr:glycoside hydrolase family 76 protein [Mycobacterium numidiamassiliense]SPM38525.1 Predicted alpha-1,6-mannanase, GH76 family [Mycobacterium numidiamassiliense]
MDRPNKGISRRGVFSAVAGAIALAAVNQPTQAVAMTAKSSLGPVALRERADLAERAVMERHVHTLWWQSGMQLGTLHWPSSLFDHLLLGRWCYWWQAHLLDCAVDAAYRARTPERIDRIGAIARGIHTRNLSGWTNGYCDDMSWLVLALERADRLLGVRFDDAVPKLRTALLDGWNPAVGAVPWKIGKDYYSTSAIGPAGIAMARLGKLSRAERLADFLNTRLRDTESGLIFDGVHEPSGRVDHSLLTYCQGVAIGLEAELALRTNDSSHRDRAAALVAGTADRLADAGVIAGGAGNDSGLFMGILARYLAQTALALGDTTAARLVHASARAAWDNRAEVDGLPLFGADWTRPVTAPAGLETFPQLAGSSLASPPNQSRDLSIQLSGWMLLEADHQLTSAGH